MFEINWHKEASDENPSLLEDRLPVPVPPFEINSDSLSEHDKSSDDDFGDSDEDSQLASSAETAAMKS